MAQDCSLQMPEDFVLPLLPGEELKDKYRRYLFRDYVEVPSSVMTRSVFLPPTCLCVSRSSAQRSNGRTLICLKVSSRNG